MDRLDKIKIVIFAFSVIFLSVYGVFSRQIINYARLTNWFVLQKVFVVTLTFSIVVVFVFSLDFFMSRLP